MSYRSEDDRSMGLCMNNFILYTDVPPREDTEQTQCNVSSTTQVESHFKTMNSIELDSSQYHTITDIGPETPIQKKLVSSSFSESVEGDYSDCDMATLMTLGKDIILVCSDSPQELEDISENRYIPIKPKPEKQEDLKCEEPTEYDVFWACTICSLDCPSQDHLRDHLLNHSVIELSDAITLSTEPMFRKKILTIDEPDLPSEVIIEQQEVISEPMPQERKANISPVPVNTPKRRIRKKDGLRSRDPHECHICGKVLSSRGNLSKHLIIHNAEKPFSCDLCKATFNAKRDKDLHYIQHHTNKRDSVCEICGKGFSSRRLLQEHYTSHDKSSSFPCSKCNKCFQTNKNLKQHIKRHNNTRSYHCDICYKIFKVKYDLRGHMRKVHSVKDFTIKEDNKCLNDTSMADSEHLLQVNPLLAEDSLCLSQETELGQQMEDSVTALIESDFPGDSNMLMTSTDRSFLVDSTDIASHKGLIFFPNQSVPEFMEQSDGVDLGDSSKEDLIPSQEVPQTFVIVKMPKNEEDTESSPGTGSPDQPVDEPENSVSDHKPIKNMPSILRRPRKS